MLFASKLPAQEWIHESDHLRGIPNGDGPVEVRIGFQLFDITDVDEKEETISFEGGIYLMWMDSRQAYDPVKVGLPNGGWVPGDYSRPPRRIYQGDFEVKEVFQGWRPYITLSNGIGNRQITNMMVGIWPDGMLYYGERFFAKAETPMNLQRFPFDRQSIQLYFHPFLYQRKEVVLIFSDAMAGSWQQDTGIAEWKKMDVEIKERPLEYVMMDGNKRISSELVVTLNIGRRPGHFLFGIILPLLILVSLSWCVFWMDEESISNRVNISLVGILSVVAYYFVIQDTVPKIPYLTMMDAFIIATFIILAASVVVSIVVDKLDRAGRKETGNRIDYACRWLFPLGYLVIILLIVLLFNI